MKGSSCREDEHPKNTKLKLDSDLYCRGGGKKKGVAAKSLISGWVSYQINYKAGGSISIAALTMPGEVRLLVRRLNKSDVKFWVQIVKSKSNMLVQLVALSLFKMDQKVRKTESILEARQLGMQAAAK